MQPIDNKKALMKKRIPTLIGLGVLVLGLVVAVVFLGTGPGVFAPRATPETTPSKIKLTNITDAGFTVSFFTSSATPGFIKYGTDSNSIKSQSGDDRDQLSGTVGSYKLHHVTVRGLKPATAYYYVLGTGTKASYDNNGSAFTIKTAARGGAPSAAKTAYGNVLTKSGSPANGAIVYATLPDVGEMSSLVKSSGSWAIPLSNARKADGSGYAVISDDDSLTLFVQGTNPALISNLSIPVLDSQPVVDITQGESVSADVSAKANDITSTDIVDSNNGQSYGDDGLVMDSDNKQSYGDDGIFVDSNNDQSYVNDTPAIHPPQPSPEIIVENTLGGSGDSTSITNEVVSDEETSTFIDFEIVEKQIVTTQTPVIGGLAAPNVIVNIVVNSETQIEQELVADENGIFALDIEALKQTLEPGEHTATYSYIDPATGEEVTKTVSFTVEPADTGTGGTSEVTPFGSGNPYSIDGATTSAEATDSAEASGSGDIATRSALPATDSAVPVSGAIETTMALVFGGIFFIMAGGWSYYLATQIEIKEI